ncbi:hypothetical protein RCC89_04495 [Cytophagaceae bacterium ABcell3]|nr:hypothetical protein RCC89_04495 [Cytophagaceae bacterium ABcell3]
MTKTFTTTDVIRFVYDDVENSEKHEINSAILMNDELLEFYHEVEALRESIAGLRLGPSDRCTDRILSYSRNFRVHTS